MGVASSRQTKVLDLAQQHARLICASLILLTTRQCSINWTGHACINMCMHVYILVSSYLIDIPTLSWSGVPWIECACLKLRINLTTVGQHFTEKAFIGKIVI